MARYRRKARPVTAPAASTAAPVRSTFRTAEAFLSAAFAEPTTEAGARYRALHSEQMERDPAHYGARSLEQLRHDASNAPVPDFDRPAAASMASTVAGAMRARIVRSVAGGRPCVPDVLSGRPDCMRRVTRTRPDAGIVRLRVVAAFAYQVPASEVTAHGLAILGAIDSLVRSGRKVELWATFGSIVTGFPEHDVDVMLKGSDAPLDWQRVAFYLANPAAVRGLFFAWQDACMAQAERAEAKSGRGYPINLPALPLEAGPASLTIPGLGMTAEHWTAEKIIRQAIA